jgi:hypothetical protein
MSLNRDNWWIFSDEWSKIGVRRWAPDWMCLFVNFKQTLTAKDKLMISLLRTVLQIMGRTGVKDKRSSPLASS